MGFPDASSGCSEEPLNVVDVVQWDDGAAEMEVTEVDTVLLGALPDIADIMIVVVGAVQVWTSALADEVAVLLDNLTLIHVSI